jgi:aspartyl-tRNA synthetase
LESFLHYLKKERKLKPIFACVDETTEQILAKDHDWRSLAVAAEERIDPTAHNPNNQTSRSNLAKKIKQATNAGVKAVECDGLPDKAAREKIEAGMQAWKGSREGKQMHTTDLLPWDDAPHRRYLYAQDKSGKVSPIPDLSENAG